MKLKDSFINYQIGDEQFLIPTDTDQFSGLVRSNPTAAFIISQLEEETTVEAILAAMKRKYHGDEKLMAEDIEKVIATLSKIGALDQTGGSDQTGASDQTGKNSVYTGASDE